MTPSPTDNRTNQMKERGSVKGGRAKNECEEDGCEKPSTVQMQCEGEGEVECRGDLLAVLFDEILIYRNANCDSGFFFWKKCQMFASL